MFKKTMTEFQCMICLLLITSSDISIALQFIKLTVAHHLRLALLILNLESAKLLIFKIFVKSLKRVEEIKVCY